MQSELVQNSKNGLIYDILNRFRVMVKRRNWRKDYRAHTRKPPHILNVNVTQGSLSHHQNESTALFQHHVSRAVYERIAVTLRDRGKRLGAARAHYHAIGHERTARYRCPLVLRCIMRRRHLLHLPHRLGSLVDQRARAPVAEHQMRLYVGAF